MKLVCFEKKRVWLEMVWAVDKFRHIPCGLELGWAAKLALALGVADEGAPFVVFFAPLESAIQTLCCLASCLCHWGKALANLVCPSCFCACTRFQSYQPPTGYQYYNVRCFLMPGYAITASGAWNNKTAVSCDPQINFEFCEWVPTCWGQPRHELKWMLSEGCISADF